MNIRRTDEEGQNRNKVNHTHIVGTKKKPRFRDDVTKKKRYYCSFAAIQPCSAEELRSQEGVEKLISASILLQTINEDI